MYLLSLLLFLYRFNHCTNLATHLRSNETAKIRYGSLFLVYPALKGFLFNSANCEKLYVPHKKNRVSPGMNLKEVTSLKPNFNWKLFWELVKPDWLLFVFSALGAFAVALVNVKTPMLLGELVNSISEILKDNSNTRNIFNELYIPCKMLVLNYVMQSVLTFAYITLLSSFGERLASRMRICLFTRLMEQDISFFDKHKTGEIMNR